MGHNPRARLEFASQLGLEALVDAAGQVQRNNRGGRDVGGEQVPFDEVDLMVDLAVVGDLSRNFYQSVVDFDTDTAGPVLLGREDDYATIARPRSYTTSSAVTWASLSMASATA